MSVQRVVTLADLVNARSQIAGECRDYLNALLHWLAKHDDDPALDPVQRQELTRRARAALSQWEAREAGVADICLPAFAAWSDIGTVTDDEITRWLGRWAGPASTVHPEDSLPRRIARLAIALGPKRDPRLPRFSDDLAGHLWRRLSAASPASAGRPLYLWLDYVPPENPGPDLVTLESRIEIHYCRLDHRRAVPAASGADAGRRRSIAGGAAAVAGALLAALAASWLLRDGGSEAGTLPPDAIVINTYDSGRPGVSATADRNALGHCPETYTDQSGIRTVRDSYAVGPDAFGGRGLSLRLDFDVSAPRPDEPFGGYVELLTGSDPCPSDRGLFDLEARGKTWLTFRLRRSDPAVDLEVALKSISPDLAGSPPTTFRPTRRCWQGGTSPRGPADEGPHSAEGPAIRSAWRLVDFRNLREANFSFARRRFVENRLPLTGWILIDDVAFE